MDLAQAMKYDTKLQVLVNCGYYDLSTPFYGMVDVVNHMDIARDLQSHIIHFKYHDSRQMVYMHVPVLQQVHDNAAVFSRCTDDQS